MPLIKSGSRAAASSNIRELMHTGKYPQKQAVAIAMSNARKYGNKFASGGVPFPRPNPYRAEPDEPRDFGEPTWPDPGDKPLERYPTKDDAAFARQYDLSYGRPDAAFFNNERYNLLKGNPNADPLEMRAVDASKRVGDGVRKPMDEYYARAALAAQRSPLAALGFNPTRTAADLDHTPEKMNITGTYNPKSDQIYANARDPSSIVHESIHRGLQKLKEGPFWKPEFNELFWHNEPITRHLMVKLMGNPEGGLGKLDKQQRDYGHTLFNENPNLSRLLAQVETAAAKHIAMTKPGGPRATGGRAYASGGNAPWEERAASRSITHAGMIHSNVPGRTDKLPITVGGGAFVVPADHLAALGQGNSQAGAAILNGMFGLGGGKKGTVVKAMRPMIPKLKKFAEGGESKPTDIVAAGGEWIIPPDKVKALGGGDLDRGHEILHNWVLRTRKQHIKTLKSLKPPKR